MKDEILKMIEQIEKVRSFVALADAEDFLVGSYKHLFAETETENWLDKEILFDEEIETLEFDDCLTFDCESEPHFYELSDLEEIESDRDQFSDYMAEVWDRKWKLIQGYEQFFKECSEKLQNVSQDLLKIANNLEAQTTENSREDEPVCQMTTEIKGNA